MRRPGVGPARRGNFRGIGGGASGPTVAAIGPFATTDRFASANSTGPQAGNDSFWWAIVADVPESTESNALIFGKTNSVSSTQGWSLSCSGTSGYALHIGNGAAVRSPAWQWCDPEGSGLHMVAGTTRGGLTIHGFKNGLPTVTKVAPALGTPTSSAFGVAIGAFSGGSAFGGKVVTAGICATTSKTDEEVADFYEALLLDPWAVPTGATHHWRAKDWSGSGNWTDNIAGLAAVVTGAPAKTAVRLSWYPRLDYTWADDTAALSPQIANTAGLLDIMCVGDSITVGTGSTSGDGFRPELLTALAGGDISNAAMVGPVNDGATDHDGRSGWTAGNHNDGNGTPADAIGAVLTAISPDIVNVLLVANHTSSDAVLNTGKTDTTTLYNTLLAAGVRIVACSGTKKDSALVAARVEEFNRWLVQEEWPRVIAAGGKLTRVNLFPGLSEPADFSDGTHPDDSGYTVIAAAVYQGCRRASGRT